MPGKYFLGGVDMDNFQTHEKVLSFLFEAFGVKKVFETGMGLYSTGLFLEKAQKVISIEMQNESWYHKIEEKYGENENFSSELFLDAKDAYGFIDSLDDSFDFAFVDGALDRWRQINKLFSKVDIIVAHDTEADCYLWNRVVLPPTWKWIDVEDSQPWTSIITCREDVGKSAVDRFGKTTVYDKYTFGDKKYLIRNSAGLQPRDMRIHDSGIS